MKRFFRLTALIASAILACVAVGVFLTACKADLGGNDGNACPPGEVLVPDANGGDSCQ